MAGTTRRTFIAGAALVSVLPLASARATPEAMAAAIKEVVGDTAIREGRVTLDVPPLIENGNTVPVTVSVESPMSEADHVKAIAIFNESNPQRDVANFFLGPRAGRATVSTRIRLATSQQLVAVAKMSDGSCWSRTVDVLVTLAACVEP